ncbi:MAG: carboxypeptidase regulatory-like domain-containing protein [Candidatus Stahlbacteria bacterium]|nr:carboxypeptidase regulatory-like domain-containing protein [Candidatus Stahlbacteria bacterium]
MKQEGGERIKIRGFLRKEGKMKTGSRIWGALTSIILALTVRGLYASTNVSGIINTNTVWNTAGSPYIVIGNVMIDTLVTLDIEPGVEVMLDSAKYIMIKGTLNAIGTGVDTTTIDSIIITKNGTGRWDRLWFMPGSEGHFRYCRIEYAGNSAIDNSADSLYIGNSTIANNLGSGILGGSPTIIGSTIANNEGGGGIQCSGAAIIIGNTITGNLARTISVCGGGISIGNGAAIITGNTITNNRADGSGGGISTYGGTTYETSPTIRGNIISGNYAGGMAGPHGGGIYVFKGSATIIGNIITNNSDNNSSWSSGAIFGCTYGVPSASPCLLTIKDNIITDNNANGISIDMDWSISIITGNTVRNNSFDGIGGGKLATITDNTVTGNANGIGASDSSTITGNVVTNNSGDGISGAGSTIISGNTVTNNSGNGIYSDIGYFSGLPTIRHNVITGTTANGIYINSGSPLIDSNSISVTGYTVRNNSVDSVNACYNYWFTTDTLVIAQKIWDYYDDFTKGIVYYKPFLSDSIPVGGSISGFVRSEGGSPLIGVYVHAFSSDTVTNGEGYTYSSDSGSYTISNLSAGNYFVEAITSGYVREYYNNVTDFDSATLVPVTVSQITPNIDFILGTQDTTTSREHLAGRVVDDNTGNPIVGLVVAFSNGADFNMAITDSNGNYFVNGLLPDSYSVYAWSPGYIAEYYNDAIAWEEANKVYASADDIDFALAPADKSGKSGVCGTISTSGKESLGDVIVYAMKDGQPVSSTRSWADGRYIIAQLPPGTYTLKATRVSYTTTDYPQPVSVANDTASGINITLPQSGVEETSDRIMAKDFLSVVYPNPSFGRPVVIVYHLPIATHATIKIYDLSGKLIRTLVNAYQKANSYTVSWNKEDDSGNKVSRGVYFCYLKSDEFKAVEKVILITK